MTNLDYVYKTLAVAERERWPLLGLVQKLEKGQYMLPDGRRRKINNDASKLMFAVGLGDLQRKLLADFRFRCRAIPGTQEIRTKIGHLGLWACVNYGNGIFCTVSPGERHNYLALKLSRYPSSLQGAGAD